MASQKLRGEFTDDDMKKAAAAVIVSEEAFIRRVEHVVHYAQLEVEERKTPSSPASEKKSADSCIEPEELCEHDA